MTVFDPGTFTLMRDPRDLPTSPEGLRTGTATIELAGRRIVLTSGDTGYAGEDRWLDGSRNFSFRGTADAGRYFAQVEVAMLPDGSAWPHTVFVLDETTNEAWTQSFNLTPGAVTGTLAVDGRLVDAAWVGTLLDDAGSAVMTAITLDLDVEKWKLLPERICD